MKVVISQLCKLNMCPLYLYLYLFILGHHHQFSSIHPQDSSIERMLPTTSSHTELKKLFITTPLTQQLKRLPSISPLTQLKLHPTELKKLPTKTPHVQLKKLSFTNLLT